jgi:hypothetical protein
MAFSGTGPWFPGTGICLLLIGGVVVGLLTNPPVQYSDFTSLPTALLISLVVGIAADWRRPTMWVGEK